MTRTVRLSSVGFQLFARVAPHERGNKCQDPRALIPPQALARTVDDELWRDTIAEFFHELPRDVSVLLADLGRHRRVHGDLLQRESV